MKEIIKQVIHGKVHLHIGKAGITSEFLSQFEILFKKRSVVKVKLLNLMDFESAKHAFIYLSTVTNSKIVDVRGKTGVFLKVKAK